MWEQMKQAMDNNSREECGSLMVGIKNRKREVMNDEVEASVEKKEVEWEDVLREKDET